MTQPKRPKFQALAHIYLISQQISPHTETLRLFGICPEQCLLLFEFLTLSYYMQTFCSEINHYRQLGALQSGICETELFKGKW